MSSSAESLRGELRANLPLTQAVKAADELYYHNKQLYSGGVKPEYSSGGGTTQQGGNQKEQSPTASKLKQTIEAAKQTVSQALQEGGASGGSVDSGALRSLQQDVESLKSENKQLRQEITNIHETLKKLNIQLPAAASSTSQQQKAPAKEDDGVDEDFDLFGSDEDEEEDEEKKRITEERLKAYAEKKSKKPGVIAKSSVMLDVKPWDDETDLKEMEGLVRSIEMDGLVWGASKLVPLAYGIQKLQILCTIEDEKVSVDADLVERIQDEFADHVQSVDIAAFNKI